MNVTLSKHNQLSNCAKVTLKLRYKALKSGNEDKFEAWLKTVEDRWLEEIADCLQGKFPDWRE